MVNDLKLQGYDVNLDNNFLENDGEEDVGGLVFDSRQRTDSIEQVK